jgi:ABC-type lipoprotein export system ATPase subunit
LPEPLLSCHSISKTYVTPSGGIEALRQIDAEFEAGVVTAVVGSSGGGKSTLLRALAGLDRPTSGHLLVEGRDLAGASPAELRRHRAERVTFVNQKPAENFVPHLTLAEHAVGAPRARELLADVGLAHRLGARPVELSGGEQARAAFALALARETPVIVADEPTAELDGDSADLLLAAIRRHTGEGTAFVIATHDPDVWSHADRVLRLERGRVAGEAQAAPAAAPAARVPTAAGAVLAASGLVRSYDGVVAVRDAQIELRPGEAGVLLGRSGSGKSTLLTLLAGWQRPDAGQVLWRGAATDPATLPWAELSYVPQRFGLVPELTVRENVELPARLAGRRAEYAGRVEELLERLGLDELAGRVPAETSIGQQQRTALARALVLRPAVLLADEPTSHQDAGWHDAVWDQLVEAAAEGTAWLAVTHEDEAEAYSTRSWTIVEGVTHPRRAIA